MSASSLSPNRIQLDLARQLSDRLEAADDATFGRFLKAKEYAEAALSLFYAAVWNETWGLPVFFGILLDVRFDHHSEKFYIFDFFDYGEEPPPGPGTRATTDKSLMLQEILIALGTTMPTPLDTLPEIETTLANSSTKKLQIYKKYTAESGHRDQITSEKNKKHTCHYSDNIDDFLKISLTSSFEHSRFQRAVDTHSSQCGAYPIQIALSAQSSAEPTAPNFRS